MSCNERGMALVSVVLMLAVLLVLSQVLVEKIWQSTRQTADADLREQLFWAAQSGVESARHQLAENYVGSGGWQSFLTTDNAGVYPADPVWTTMINGQRVELYTRDNADGDSDFGRDNDLKLYVLARARGRRGGEALVESLCGFDSLALEAATSVSRQAVAGNLIDLAEQSANTHDIAD